MIVRKRGVDSAGRFGCIRPAQAKNLRLAVTGRRANAVIDRRHGGGPTGSQYPGNERYAVIIIA